MTRVRDVLLSSAKPAPLIDGFQRHIKYLRLSVTDRCDLRCTYCMPERMTFLPRKEVLSLEELYKLSLGFIARGVTKIRVTGGEPLVRRDIIDLFRALGRKLGDGLEELTLTTNATQLVQHADELASAGVKRVNISLDTRDREQFAKLSRRDVLPLVLEGIAAAKEAGLKVKINSVALKGVNEQELPDLIAWSHGESFDHTLIEVMPLGDVDEDRVDHFLPLSDVREQLEQRWTLTPLSESSGGPARYDRIEETGGKLGMITPLTNNFCAGCNRLRVTATGQLYPCLGGGERVDLRAALRSDDPEANLQAALNEAMRIKPERHHFDISERGAEPAQPRHMSMTGG
ncbi:GTP 3',8-cyclase MoaA [Altererythrobacter sp.]|uniref:GTP 3',8-cyclase MoaA n=1 Tax=Altererythrobacter sp. TaxID=1872480 RepID=UPI001B136901|nr:GTP 3',8-cyclase MoaA [Altererythrobacter sp.]MBO6609754.1 GTP 3',8-cyclase MoaA [Altererythrobacter sp.]MBO6641044.1 GTP 3',8-cyclase MoaA [Altererythrobacter sp.]MBO6708258.1 GTP 3',8-cyclase MoaA [Altererythrobacter sp.]